MQLQHPCCAGRWTQPAVTALLPCKPRVWHCVLLADGTAVRLQTWVQGYEHDRTRAVAELLSFFVQVGLRTCLWCMHPSSDSSGPLRLYVAPCIKVSPGRGHQWSLWCAGLRLRVQRDRGGSGGGRGGQADAARAAPGLRGALAQMQQICRSQMNTLRLKSKHAGGTCGSPCGTHSAGHAEHSLCRNANHDWGTSLASVLCRH